MAAAARAPTPGKEMRDGAAVAFKFIRYFSADSARPLRFERRLAKAKGKIACTDPRTPSARNPCTATRSSRCYSLKLTCTPPTRTSTGLFTRPAIRFQPDLSTGDRPNFLSQDGKQFFLAQPENVWTDAEDFERAVRDALRKNDYENLE